MQVHIFKGTGRVFACTESATGANLPAKYGPWAAFKTLDLNRGMEPVGGMNVTECLDDIEAHGFYITDAHVRITQNVV
jgi:hypothetical protein